MSATVLDLPPRTVAHIINVSADAGNGHDVRMTLKVQPNGVIDGGHIEPFVYEFELSEPEMAALADLQGSLKRAGRMLADIPVLEGTIAAALVREARLLRREISDE